ncbi:MAG: efflux RND transporter permease subunit, partial [Bradymonadaceae bacterium]
ANLLMLIFIVGGLLMMPRIKQEVFPEVTLDVVTVRIPYPGAGPEEVEQGVVLPAEEAVREVEGIDEVRSTAAEGVGTVSAELLTSTDPQRALNDIKSAIDRITAFPEDAEEPVVSLATNRRQVVTIVIHGDVDRQTLEQLGERARNELLQHKNISVVDVTGLPPPEISIEVPQENFRRYGLSLPELADRIAAASVELPGGSVRTEGGEILIRTTERRKTAEAFRDVAVISQPDGTRVTLGEIANIEETYRETDRATFFNGESAVKVEVFRVGDQTPLEIAEAVDQFVERRNATGSVDVEYAVWNDQSDIYRSRIDLLLNNSYLGLALVLSILGLFLQLKVAFWTTMGIVISFLGAVLFMPALGVSLNMISLFAFILTLGIVVDDAIVIGEAVYTKRKEGMAPLEAALAGTREVGIPVTFAVLTTITAFAPMLFIPGVMGKFFVNIPMIVIPIFLISLIEVLFILPAHLAHSKPPRESGVLGAVNRFQSRFSDRVERFIDQVYRPFADRAVRYRYVTLAVAIALLAGTLGLVGGGYLNFTFMPRIEGDEVIASVEMPFGTPVDETREVTERLVEAAQQVAREADGSDGDVTTGILAELGTSSILERGPPGGGGGESGGHLTQVAVALVPAADREITSREFTRRWRERVGEVAGAETVDFQFDIGPGAGKPVSFELRHEDTEVLRRAASDLAEALKSYGGVFDVDDGFQMGKQQLDLTLQPAARALGVTEQMLARQVRGAFFGAEVARVQRGRDEVRIYVRRPEAERASQWNVENLIIRTPKGGEIPLERAAHIERDRASTRIERKGGARVVDVTADVNPNVTTGSEITDTVAQKVLPSLMERYPGLSWELSGEQQQQHESLRALGVGFLLALLVMFTLMAVAFKSYVQPLIIMVAIPFGAVGAVAGHLLLGYNLSLVSVLGLVALAGVVVNDSLVLVDAVNGFRAEGHSPLEAVRHGGARRFRPILLTSLTTFFGLAPMIFVTSVQARFLIPMALSLGFGVLFVTAIALIIVPSLYLTIVDVKYVLGLGPPSRESGEAAEPQSRKRKTTERKSSQTQCRFTPAASCRR